MLNRTTYLLRLREICGDDDVDVDGLTLAGDASEPLFRDMNGDGYSAIDINTDVLGHMAVEGLILAQNERMDEFDEEVVFILAGILGNQNLGKKQLPVVKEAVDFCNEALLNPQVEQLISSYLAGSPCWNIRILKPARLTLFMLHDPEKAKLLRRDITEARFYPNARI